MKKGGRPIKELDKELFEDLASLGCSEAEICWAFRDRDTGRPISTNTLNSFVKREYGIGFCEYIKKYGLSKLKISLRRYQLALAEKNTAMAIFLGKQYLGQRDNPVDEDVDVDKLMELLQRVKSE